MSQVIRKLDVVVVIEDEHGVRTGCARPLERVGDPVPTAATVAADTVLVLRGGVGRRLVDDVDHGHVGIALTEVGHPVLDRGFAVAVVHPTRLLGAPDKAVLFKNDLVVVAVFVHGVQRVPEK
jgi:hypothetical protein